MADDNLLVVFLVLLLGSSVLASLEGLDLGLDAGLALLAGECWSLVLLRLGLPVSILLSSLERGILPNGSVCVRVDLLNVF